MNEVKLQPYSPAGIKDLKSNTQVKMIDVDSFSNTPANKVEAQIIDIAANNQVQSSEHELDSFFDPREMLEK